MAWQTTHGGDLFMKCPECGATAHPLPSSKLALKAAGLISRKGAGPLLEGR
jgi:hypothetical protein